MNVQSKDELEKWHSTKDPWNYESGTDDAKRKQILLSAIPSGTYSRVLDVGCGQGFITRDLPGELVIGVDISENAILHARQNESDRVKFQPGSIHDLESLFPNKFDLIVITGVLYPHYIGQSTDLIYTTIDNLLTDRGLLVSVHIREWYKMRFPWLRCKTICYQFGKYEHLLEMYRKL